MNARARKVAGFLRRSGSSLIVLAALAGVAVWGHRTGWKAPKLSALRQPAPAEAEDWCTLHSVPRSRCVACRPDLSGADAADWCREHGLPESKCTICHPEILTRGEASDWCAEHGVPESQCSLCNPDVAVKGQPADATDSATVTADSAGSPEKRSMACMLHELRVQFASPEAVKKAGVRVETVVERPMAAHVAAPGEIEYDRRRVARVSSRAAGTVWKLVKDSGESVKEGDLLALIDAAEAGRARADLLKALAAVEVRARALARIQAAAVTGSRTQGELEEAEAAHRAARIELLAAEQALRNLGLAAGAAELERLPADDLARRAPALGLPEAAAAALGPAAASGSFLPVLSPLAGVIADVSAAAGEAVEAGRPLFTVADTSRMWAVIDVHQEDAARIAVGQRVSFRMDGSAEEAAEGKLAWISTALDEKTRTLKARAELVNPEGRLLAHAFGSARIIVREKPDAVVVPAQAVHWEGCCHIVFVKAAEDLFLTRKVRLGLTNGGFREVLAGVAPGEVVATTGSHVLKSEILKSRFGAGCCVE